MSLFDEDLQSKVELQAIADNRERLARKVTSRGVEPETFQYVEIDGLTFRVLTILPVPIPQRANFGRHSLNAIKTQGSHIKTASADSRKRAKNNRLGGK